MTDAEFLDWVADRLVMVYGVDGGMDYVRRLRRMADDARPQSFFGFPVVIDDTLPPDTMRFVDYKREFISGFEEKA